MTLIKESQKFQCFVLSSPPPPPSFPKKKKKKKRKEKKSSEAELAIIPKDN
jgi:hypothetical protein